MLSEWLPITMHTQQTLCHKRMSKKFLSTSRLEKETVLLRLPMAVAGSVQTLADLKQLTAGFCGLWCKSIHWAVSSPTALSGPCSGCAAGPTMSTEQVGLISLPVDRMGQVPLGKNTGRVPTDSDL